MLNKHNIQNTHNLQNKNDQHNIIQLKKHQLIPIQFMKNNKGLIIYHSTGSGKTLTSLFAMYQFDKPIIVIGPKSSKKAFNDNIIKARLDQSRITFYTFAKIKTLMETDMDMFVNKSVIVDEAHNLRNESIANLMLSSALNKAFKLILLSATPVINYVNDFAVLINIVKGYDDLPTERELFNNMYYDTYTGKITNRDILTKKLQNSVSYYQQSNDDNYPKAITKYMQVVMNKEQMKEYVYYVKKIIFKETFNHAKYNINDKTFFVNLHSVDKKKKNNFLAATRQLSNAVDNQISPKIIQMFEVIKKGPFPCVIYSYFLKNGVYLIAGLLEKNNISYATITGNVTDDKINSVVNKYNDTQYKVLLLSSAGSESLDLKNTRQIHIMEPHWNENKITQVIGRAIRYQSHNSLKVKDRNVIIYRWISTFPEDIATQSADQYLMELSEKKNIIAEDFVEIIKKVAIENNGKKNNNNNNFDEQYLKYKKKYMRLKK